MEPQTSMQVTAILFGVAASGGLIMAFMRLRGTVHPPSWLAMGHGFLATAGLTLLVYAQWVVGLPPLALAALALLLLTAVGGILMNLRYHLRHLPLPIPLMTGHALLALTGIALLLLSLK